MSAEDVSAVHEEATHSQQGEVAEAPAKSRRSGVNLEDHDPSDECDPVFGNPYTTVANNHESKPVEIPSPSLEYWRCRKCLLVEDPPHRRTNVAQLWKHNDDVINKLHAG